MALPPETSRTEGSLLDPFLSLQEARRRLGAWAGEGRLSAVAPAPLLEALRGEAGGLRLYGAVAFPSGAHTLTTKRVELLEVARVEAWGAEVALSPHLLLEGPLGALEEEMTALLKTAPELEVRFAVEWCRLPREARTRLLRLLRDHRPGALRVSLGPYGPPPGPEEVRSLRGKLHGGVPLKVPARDRAEAERLLEAGADLVETAVRDGGEEAP